MGLIILYVFGYMESENSFTRAQFLTRDFVTLEELGTRERIFRFHMPRHTGLAQSLHGLHLDVLDDLPGN